MSKRAGERDLAAALRDPGFSPSEREVGRLLAFGLAGDEETARLAERALARTASASRAAADALGSEPDAAKRKRLVRWLGRWLARAPNEELACVLASSLDDPDPRPRAAAATALGRLGEAQIEARLLEALAREAHPTARRAIVEALGKVGGDASREALARIEGEGAAPVTLAARRASLILTREAARAAPSTVDLAADLPAPARVVLRARAGLESIVASELEALSPRRRAGGALGSRLEAVVRGAPASLLESRALLSFGFVIDVAPSREKDGDNAANAIAVSLTSPPSLALFRALTRGPLRVRVSFAGRGKRRAELWQLADAIAAQKTELVNDAREAPWHAIVHERDGATALELVPAFDDPRFAYRKRDVPASSHPTIAAALARIAGAAARDVVWDPFCGSGLELAERARLGPYASLFGSDRDATALEAARENLEGFADVELFLGDAIEFTPPARPTLVITNPPLGRRVERSAELVILLERFVAHVARTLAPGGRFVWLSPSPARTLARATREGLVLDRAFDVDLGGFTATLQRFSKPRAR